VMLAGMAARRAEYPYLPSGTGRHVDPQVGP